ncbi:hypothetical protein H0H92_000884 [Tricholoma furcatifolium]|nr:hypothetical protein H0H92_000884 [Tricholoma furcatifolium]
MCAASPVIIYRYDASPYSVKIDNLLILKKIPHQRVNASRTFVNLLNAVSPVLPRPEITDLLGVTYRRIPLLAIGNDVYCDTSLIASVLEKRFPASESTGYGTIFPRLKHTPSADTGAIKMFSKQFEMSVFPSAANLLHWEKLPKSFVEDRSLLFSAPIDVQAVVGLQGKSLTALSSQMSLLEEQLNDGREWLFDSELPSLADITVHFVLNWVRRVGIRPAKELFDVSKIPKTLSWLTRVSNHLQHERDNQVVAQVITGDRAAELIVSSTHEQEHVVGFDVQQAGRLGFKMNDRVEVTPDDSGTPSYEI